MEEYFAAKQLLFAGAGGAAAAVRGDQSRRRVRRAASRLDPKTRSAVVRPGRRMPTLRARHISSGFQGLRFDVQFGKHALSRRVAADRARSTCITFWRRAARRSAYGIAPETDRARHRRSARRCRAGSNASTKGSRSWWWWTTRTPTTRCATSSRWRADLNPKRVDHAVRLRRRPRPHQASADGAGGGGSRATSSCSPATIRAPKIRWRS